MADWRAPDCRVARRRGQRNPLDVAHNAGLFETVQQLAPSTVCEDRVQVNRPAASPTAMFIRPNHWPCG